LTTNRPDLLCHLGIARELSALLHRPLREPPSSLQETGASSPLAVEIREPGLCARYIARHLPGVEVGPAPAWLQRRLRAVGQKPINNVVDAGNYVMFESGQPLHAFDAARLAGGIVVRRAAAGEEIACLDGRTRRLVDDDLVIADQRAAVAIAGIIGGADSAVSAATTSVLIEAANFRGVSVRNTSRRLALRTEASTRFEKQLSPELADAASARLAELVQQVAAGGPSSAPFDTYPGKVPEAPIHVRAGFVGRLLGVELSDDEVTRALSSLFFDVRQGAEGLEVVQPSFRRDVRADVDLVEEVGRLRGYNSLPSTLPGHAAEVRDIMPPPDPEWTARDVALGAGFDEAIPPAFVGPDDPGMGVFPVARLRLSNPMSVEQSQLRTSTLWGLARAVARNVALGNSGAALFEVAHVFWPQEGAELPREPRVIGAAAHLPPGSASSGPSSRRSLLELKGLLDLLADEVAGVALEYKQVGVPGLHPGRAATVGLDGREIGCVGQLHPDLVRGLDVPGTIILAEIDFEALVSARRPIRYRVPSKFPAVLRDLSIAVPELTPARDIVEAISDAGEVILRTVELFDEYHGSQVEGGRKGLAFRLVFQSDDRTLTGEEVAAAEGRIVRLVGERFAASVRD
ncbi:MAG: phenylalanine--tRNA ligase subunit beta, partial [Candidatus Dormibacteraeota bacterium]|nr:phenylalanine--tRNA ligase subunit beta [Candidatus Dormibacteraeota bacterium]